MGKRKRRAQRPPIAPLSPPVEIPCCSGLNQLATQKYSAYTNTRGKQPRSSAKDVMGSHEQQNTQFSLYHHHHHHQNPGRSLYMKRSQHHGHHFPRHSPGYHYSTYHGKSNSFFDHQMCFKASYRWNSELGSTKEFREKALFKPERIRASNIVMEAEPEADEKMVCGTCQRLLRQKRLLSSSLLTIEPCVVAVLVCGHVFHADCLEQRTRAEDASDPPCPLCSELASKTEAA